LSKKNKCKKNFVISKPLFSSQIKPIEQSTIPYHQEYLTFSLGFLHNKYCLDQKDCNLKNIKSLVKKISMLCNLKWYQIESLPREKTGYEKIPLSQISVRKPSNFPNEITEDVENIMVFRYNNENSRFAGIRFRSTFFIWYIDPNLTLYRTH
jgi:hypothetical protein